jgi:hypothetical protein
MYSWLRTEAPRNYDEEIEKAYHEGDQQGQGKGEGQEQSTKPRPDQQSGEQPQPA